MFSATGSLLPGSYQRPDIVIAVTESQGSTVRTIVVCKFNKFGYTPLGTITGLGRALLGIIHTIVHLVCAFFDRQNRVQHIQEAIFGAKHIVRGIIEAIPIVGNLAMFILDTIRGCKLMQGTRNIACNDEVLLSAYGEIIARKSFTDPALGEWMRGNQNQSDLIKIVAAPQWIGYF